MTILSIALATLVALIILRLLFTAAARRRNLRK
jgi:hypothetical protein